MNSPQFPSSGDELARNMERLGWRPRPGILGRYAATPQSIHALLGYFLSDRSSPTPFPGRDLLLDPQLYEWGVAPPLERVIDSDAALDVLLRLPEVLRNSVSIVEPWRSVGSNRAGEAVRASKNTAYILQQVADADSVLYPVWRSGIDDAARLAQVLSGGLATVVQGGSPSVYDASSFDGARAGREDILALVQNLLLQRSPGSGPAIYVCLGHQLAAEAHVRLIRRAVREVAALDFLPLDRHGHGLDALRRACERIAAVGDALPVVKQGEIIARGWHDTYFAVAPNEALEVGTRRLLDYRRHGGGEHVPGELHEAHALVADELDGVIDTMIRLERELHIEMFHGDEVNEEAALFANWAYKLLHDTLVPIRYEVAVSPLAWLLSMPYAVEILSRTQVDVVNWTEVSTTCIYYKDWETHTIRRSFTCQFHPELMADIRDVGRREGPRYEELKDNDGVRLFIRLLYHGMQE